MTISIKKVLLFIVIILLFINGTGALYGGWHLISDSTGNSLQLPLSYLSHSPFKNYLIPGIVLLIVNGIGSITVIVSIMLKYKIYPLLIIVQGIMLTGWMVVQMLILQMFYPPMHLPFLSMGIFFIIAGFYFKKSN